MAWIVQLVAALFATLLEKIFGARASAAERAESDAAHERAAVAEAANETQQAISEVSDDRSKLDPSPSDAADLSRRLRERAKQRAADGDADVEG